MWYSDIHELNPAEGDLIEFKRTTYCHWALYLGDGKVVHFNPADKQEKVGVFKLETFIPGLISVDELVTVAGKSEARINNKTELELKSRGFKDIQKITEALLEFPRELDYCLKHFNCEHFVTFLKFGRRHSEQANPFIRIFHSILLNALIFTLPGRIYKHIMTIAKIKEIEATLEKILQTTEISEVFIS